jgi:DNA polymerase III epsilon subunit-like protein
MSTDTPPDPPSPAPDVTPAADGSEADTPAATSTARRQGRTRFVFMDTEATGLDHRRHELTEVSWVVRFEDGREEERQFFPEHTTDGADADALELTRYEDRIAPQRRTSASEWLTLFLEDARDAVLVGAVPDFDAKHLERMCRKVGLEPTWDHHLLDVETLALPFIAPGPEAPRSLAKTCAALGIPHDKDQAHGALYDAQQAMRVFDRVWQLVADLRASGDPLPPPVPRDANGRNGGNGDSRPAAAGAGAGPTDAGPTDAGATAEGPTSAPGRVPGATEPGDDPELSPEERAERATHHG